MRKKLLFQGNNFFSLRFLILLSLIAFNLQTQRGQKIYWILLCKSKERFFKTYKVKGKFLKKTIFRLEKTVLACFPGITCDAVENTIFWKRDIWAVFVLWSIKNLSEQFITAHNVSWHFFCIIKLRFDRTYEADGDIM